MHARVNGCFTSNHLDSLSKHYRLCMLNNIILIVTWWHHFYCHTMTSFLLSHNVIIFIATQWHHFYCHTMSSFLLPHDDIIFYFNCSRFLCNKNDVHVLLYITSRYLSQFLFGPIFWCPPYQQNKEACIYKELQPPNRQCHTSCGSHSSNIWNLTLTTLWWVQCNHGQFIHRGWGL